LRLVEVADLALLDLPWHRLHRAHDIPDQLGLLIRAHQTEQVTRLGVVIVADAVILAGSNPQLLAYNFATRQPVHP
jgi:hypothetical protein